MCHKIPFSNVAKLAALVPAGRRAALAKGGMFLVNARLLVTDLLGDRLRPEAIEGAPPLHHSEYFARMESNVAAVVAGVVVAVLLYPGRGQPLPLRIIARHE